jgi:putative transposase
MPPIAARRGPRRASWSFGDGGPLGVVIAGAHVVEQKLLRGTIEAIVVERPETDEQEQHPCLDKGYDNPRRPRGDDRCGLYAAHPSDRRGGEAVHRSKGHKSGRWVV